MSGPSRRREIRAIIALGVTTIIADALVRVLIPTDIYAYRYPTITRFSVDGISFVGACRPALP